MKVIVLGAGVIGVTSAYYLAKAGHSVTVLDRREGPALETSYANAGEISPGYAAPWASPQVPFKAIKWLLSEHSPLVIRPTPDPQMLLWIMRMLRNCTSSRYATNKSRMVRLAEYSRDCLIELRSSVQFDYDGRSRGTLELFREPRAMHAAQADIAILRDQGVPFEILDEDGCIAAEPALARVRDRFVGGLRLPDDETGDCFKFTSELANVARTTGVQFHFGQTILGFETANQSILSIRTAALQSNERWTADCYVMALGSFTARHCAQLDISIPVYPVKGYSLTIPIEDESSAPESTVMDERYKVAITRLGDRVRVGGTAELSGYSTDLPLARRATLAHSVGQLFPGCGNAAEAEFWSGLRPMTPDGTPIVGPTPYKNLWLSTGHGTLGWTMACGSAKLLSDRISGAATKIDPADYELTRYRSP